MLPQDSKNIVNSDRGISGNETVHAVCHSRGLAASTSAVAGSYFADAEGSVSRTR